MEKITNSFSQFYDSLSNSFVSVLPNLLIILSAVVASVLIGFFVGILIRLTHLDKWVEKGRLFRTTLRGSNLPTHKFLGRVVATIFLVISLENIAALNGWGSLRKGFKDFSSFLPLLVGSLIILVVGLFVARYIQKTVEILLARSGSKSASVFSKISFYTVMVVIISIALNHIGVNIGIVTNNISIILGSVLLAFSISFAYASRELLGNILSSSYNKRNFEIGQMVYVNGMKGEIIKMTNLSIFIKTTDRIKIIPAKQFTDQVVEIIG